MNKSHGRLPSPLLPPAASPSRPPATAIAPGNKRPSASQTRLVPVRAFISDAGTERASPAASPCSSRRPRHEVRPLATSRVFVGSLRFQGMGACDVRRFECCAPDPRRRRLDLAAARADLCGGARIGWDLGFRNPIGILRARGCSPLHHRSRCLILIRVGLSHVPHLKS